jgi:hypothetical protein
MRPSPPPAASARSSSAVKYRKRASAAEAPIESAFSSHPQTQRAVATAPLGASPATKSAPPAQPSTQPPPQLQQQPHHQPQHPPPAFGSRSARFVASEAELLSPSSSSTSLFPSLVKGGAGQSSTAFLLSSSTGVPPSAASTAALASYPSAVPLSLAARRPDLLEQVDEDLARQFRLLSSSGSDSVSLPIVSKVAASTEHRRFSLSSIEAALLVVSPAEAEKDRARYQLSQSLLLQDDSNDLMFAPTESKEMMATPIKAPSANTTRPRPSPASIAALVEYTASGHRKKGKTPRSTKKSNKPPAAIHSARKQHVLGGTPVETPATQHVLQSPQKSASVAAASAATSTISAATTVSAVTSAEADLPPPRV